MANKKKQLPASGVSESDRLFHSIKGLAASLQKLNQQAVEAYTPVVEDILRSRHPDVQHIEHTLDGLLGFCSSEPALHLFKKLCRCYFAIDPTATVEHINAYREMWDSEEKEVKHRAPTRDKAAVPRAASRPRRRLEHIP